MIIAVSASGAQPDPMFDASFGHCARFIIFDSRTGISQVLENPARRLHDTQGLRTATTLVNFGVQVLISSYLPQGAADIISNCGVRLVAQGHGSVRDVLGRFIQQQLQEVPGTQNSSMVHEQTVAPG